MKDMSVKELIVKCGVGWNDFKAELLRRFEEATQCPACGSIIQYSDYMRGDEIKRDDEFFSKLESLKCCGNCKLHNNNCPNEWNPTDEKSVLIPSSGYCSHWQTDGLTRADREGK